MTAHLNKVTSPEVEKAGLIDRYEIEAILDMNYNSTLCVESQDDGEWVKYSDHISELAKLQSVINELTAEIESQKVSNNVDSLRAAIKHVRAVNVKTMSILMFMGREGLILADEIHQADFMLWKSFKYHSNQGETE